MLNLNRSRIEDIHNSQFNLSTHNHGPEPMHHSPIADRGDHRVSYLPCYLMGDPAKSPKGKLRKEPGGPNLDLSGMNAGMNVSGGAVSGSPPGQTSPLQGSHYHNLNASNSSSPFMMSSVQSSTNKPRTTGPPKQSLGHSSMMTPTTQGVTPIVSPSTYNSPLSDLSQGNWITIFGFQPASQQLVLQNFSTIGSIVDYKATPGCNWIHVKYSNSVEARKALSKNGGIIGGSIMIGVIKCENPPKIINNDSVKTRIRPLANDNIANQVPIRESSIMSKVTEFFGW